MDGSTAKQSEKDGGDDEDAETARGRHQTKSVTPPSPATTRDFHQDIQRWRHLYESCMSKLQELQVLKKDRDAGEVSQCWQQLKGDMEAAARTLDQEHAIVEAALQQHNEVLSELLGRLQKHLGQASRRSSGTDEVRTVDKQLLDRLGIASTADRERPKHVSSTIRILKDLISDHETLNKKVEQERARRRKMLAALQQVPDETLPVAEDRLHRTNSRLKLQVKRLQYELSRLTEAQALEADATAALLLQSEDDLKRNVQAATELKATNDSLKEGVTHRKVTDSTDLYRDASGISFLGSLEDLRHGAEVRARLESRIYSDRVYKDVDLIDDENDILHCIGQELSRQIADMNEQARVTQTAWMDLRQERDQLTKDLYPQLERLRELQEMAKDQVELESKLRKENYLFKNQLEDFQKDLLEVETDLLTGDISRRTKATKNLVSQLDNLRETIELQNAMLRKEMLEKNLNISTVDSLASTAMDEGRFNEQINEKMKKMELRIEAELDRRTLFKPKKYVLEPPSASKVPFRGQRNVIKVSSKNFDWRRKTTAELHKQERMERQVEQLRREILGKLTQEKEKAKAHLLRYESERHGAVAEETPSEEDHAKATKELRSILGQIDAFLHRSKLEDRASEHQLGQQLQKQDFGENMKALIFQLEKLQSALEGNEGRPREPKYKEGGRALQRGQELLDQLPNTPGTSGSSARRGSGTRCESQGSSNPEK